MTVGHDAEAVSSVAQEVGARPEMLVQILVRLVERFGWVSEVAVRRLAEELNLSRAEVHGVVSYYHDFRTSPPGLHVVKICQAEACQAMGSRELTAHATRRLGTRLNATATDVTLEPVYCLGNCACAPAIMVDGNTYGRVDAARFDALLAAARRDGQ